jgi:excisionase family DNA binding protein
LSARASRPAQALRLISKPRAKSANRVDQVRRREPSSSSMNGELDFPALLTSTEVARLLRVNERTLRRLRTEDSDSFPKPLQLGRVIRWRADDVKAWMEGRQ